jgi:hypothetical protein
MEALLIQKQLNDKAQEGYRLVGIVPSKQGSKPNVFLVLEKEEGPAAGASGQRAKLFATG